MSEERRWGIFCRRHDEKMRNLVCGSEMESESVVTHLLTASVHLSKNEEANEADPTGCPRSRKPLVSLSGLVDVVSAGSGSLENVAMVFVRDRPSAGFVVVSASMGEELLHDVSNRVLNVFLTKHPSAAPCVFRVVQRNSRSGR